VNWFKDVSGFDWFDLTIILSLFGMAFYYGGRKWRWHTNVGLLALHLVALRYFLHVLDYPIGALALLHAGLALILLAWSETNYGRMTGLCFLAMLALDGLVIAGLLDGSIRLGLHWSYFNYISALQHVQALTLATCFYRGRAKSCQAV